MITTKNKAKYPYFMVFVLPDEYPIGSYHLLDLATDSLNDVCELIESAAGSIGVAVCTENDSRLIYFEWCYDKRFPDWALTQLNEVHYDSIWSDDVVTDIKYFKTKEEARKEFINIIKETKFYSYTNCRYEISPERKLRNEVYS